MKILEFNADGVRVFLGDISDIDLDRVDENIFSNYRIKKTHKIKNTNSLRQSIGAELVLIYAVKKCFNIDPPVDYRADDRGKTYFNNIDAFFSLSHSGRYVACVISENEVGVDIQKKREPNMKLAERFFTKSEYESVKKDPIDKFNRIWTRKEAVSKAVGDGLQIGFPQIDVLDRYISHRGAVYKIYDIACSEGYSMSVAVKCPWQP